MDYTLTTGQVIDQIFPGEVYETELPSGIKNHVTLDDKGLLSFCDKYGNFRPFLNFFVTDNTRGLTWALVPNEAPWKEAYKHLKNGGVIKSIMDGMKDWTYQMKEDGSNPHIDIDRIELGKWLIVRGAK
jgi:hypothetical protein